MARQLRGARDPRVHPREQCACRRFRTVPRADDLPRRRARRSARWAWLPSRSGSRSCRPTRSSRGRISVSRPTADAASNTTRASWIWSAPIPRGTIYDRTGLPLATDDAAVIAAARPKYEQLGVALGDRLSESGQRCYPLGARAYHVLGDARTRVNWSASNTSFVERDANDRLRASTIARPYCRRRTRRGSRCSRSGATTATSCPLLRHRYEPEHPAALALRSSAARRTPDDRRQSAGSDCRPSSQDYAVSAQGRAAAVVIDPDTGALLASVSYPWPAMDGVLPARTTT